MSTSAHSIDGRSFVFETSLDAAVPVGAYVTVSPPGGGQLLGQVLDEAMGESGPAGRSIRGSGTLLAVIGDGGARPVDGTAVFGEADLAVADHDLVAAYLGDTGSSAALEFGHVQGMPDVPAVLNAKGFGRHTFLCGQSGSGKTYTLGLILERLLMDTDIRIVTIDPNSDFVNLASVRSADESGMPADQYAGLVSRFEPAASRIQVFGGEGSERRLRARYGRLSLVQQTMILGIDPIADAEEYNAFLRVVNSIGSDDYTLDDVMHAVRSSFDDDVRRLGLRIENTGAAEQSIWAGADEPVMEALSDDWRMLVADIGSLGSMREGAIASAALLAFMWENRHARQPVIIVIDEAHNVCPQNPVDENQALATELVVRIAGEGRKFGLYLLLSTQRPGKVHQNVISQCDNLLLMKMNSATDIATLAETFSYAPASLIERASSFGLGQGLAAGKIAPDPLMFQSGRRLTLEGGSDVPSTWATGPATS